MQRYLIGFVIVCLGCLSATAQGQDNQPNHKQQDQIDALIKRINDLEDANKQHAEEIATLKATIAELSAGKKETPEDEALKAELEKALGGGQGQPSAPATGAPGQLKLIDVSYDILTTAGWSTADQTLLGQLQGGDHDPKDRGFNIRNLEFSLNGAVDPYFNAEMHTVFKLGPDGGTETEVEEAFLTTTSLPNSMEIKSGQYFTQFGRLNARHPHAWNFVDAPVITSRLLGGDGLRNPGVQLSYLTPFHWYSEFILGTQNAGGGTAASFLGSDGPAGTPTIDRQVRSLGDMLYTARWFNSWELSDEKTVNLGFSSAFGPNNTGPTNRTQLYGTDLYYKWKPRVNDHGFPFLAIQAEAMSRTFQAGGVTTSRQDLKDWGWYSEFNYGYQRNWVAGLRFDYADANGDNSADPLRARRWRVSPALTWYPSEFSRIRLQYNYDQSDFLGMPQHSIWLQYEVGFGAHPAHKF